VEPKKMTHQEGVLKIKVRAVMFDYGNVLSLPQPRSAVEHMAEICRVPLDLFEKGYWGDRLAYDRGDLDATQYWQSRMRMWGVTLSADQIGRVVQADCDSWSHLNPVAADWIRQLHSTGVPLALLSNMPLDLRNYLVSHLQLFSYFQHLVFSCDVRLIKPDPAIYQRSLDGLDLAPQEVLFLDDKLENVQGARNLGMKGLVVESLEAVLAQIKEEFDLPVPDPLPVSAGSFAE
jgi:putative hydrolase of the HAD superfamily